MAYFDLPDQPEVVEEVEEALSSPPQETPAAPFVDIRMWWAVYYTPQTRDGIHLPYRLGTGFLDVIQSLVVKWKTADDMRYVFGPFLSPKGRLPDLPAFTSIDEINVYFANNSELLGLVEGTGDTDIRGAAAPRKAGVRRARGAKSAAGSQAST